MPKIVDRDHQRAEIGDALLRVLAAGGLEQVTVRTVAAESGRSPGAVQKYFRNKDDMLLFALDLVCARAQQRMRAVEPTDQLGTVKAILRETLPLDEKRRAEMIVWHAFVGAAAGREDMAAKIREVDDQARAELAELVDQERADAIIALVDGLGYRMLYSPLRIPELLAALDVGLIALLQPPER